MLRAFLMIVLTACASCGWAFDIKSPEVLNFKVYWGPLKMGNVQLDYVPAVGAKGTTYTVKAHVWDESSFIAMDDTWQATGAHTEARVFVPDHYIALQRENDYRADKMVTFDAATKKVTYQNRRDAGDKVEPIVWDGMMRDALSAVYAWRMMDAEALKKGERVTVMGVKRPYVLVRSAAVRGQVMVNNKPVNVWSVNLTSEMDGKVSKDSWIVKLRDDGRLTPVQVIARNKFGTFTANLKE